MKHKILTCQQLRKFYLNLLIFCQNFIYQGLIEIIKKIIRKILSSSKHSDVLQFYIIIHYFSIDFFIVYLFK